MVWVQVQGLTQKIVFFFDRLELRHTNWFHSMLDLISNLNNSKSLTECEPEIQAYFPEKLFWWKNNQSESQTQNWQHFLSRCHTKKDKNQVFPL